jgi:oxygen-independent coproporphyrinogen-3 oxidase
MNLTIGQTAVGAERSQEDLIRQYNVPAPRYTSYPTVPCWDKQVPEEARWWEVVQKTFNETNRQKGISLYIHLPFCESLCTYCACNTRITRNHAVEVPYLEAVLAEWDMYISRMKGRPQLREMHLGGGTPTFFSPENLQKLLEGILQRVRLHPHFSFSFEGHPNNTTAAHLQTLYDLGFKRVSYGIQDFDERVQKAIHRMQPYHHVRRATEEARRTGYDSVNFDLVYGLPFQTLESMEQTLEKVGQLRPDRIAFYSYAHVPWMRPGQRSFTEADLPDSKTKRALYELGMQKFTEWGYRDVGMDHFALPGDSLFEAADQGTLHRNFMGYTTCATDLLIGLGTSAISDARGAYLQNIKTVEEYTATVKAKQLPILKGHLLTEEDQLIRQAILDLVCRGQLSWTDELLATLDHQALAELKRMQEEGLLLNNEKALTVLPTGRAFLRNIAMVFDRRLRTEQRPAQAPKQFSQAI